MVLILLSAVLVSGQAEPAAKSATPPPLSEEQLTRLRTLVRSTQTAAETLRHELADRERRLAEQYAQFELDAAAAEKLQAEIVGLQKQLLANYHQLQVELRKIVGPERFAQLKRRLDHSLRPPAKTDPPREKQAAPTQGEKS